MVLRVPYVTDEAIEKDVCQLLTAFGKSRGAMLEPPIPIEDIIEKHLKIGLEFDDLHTMFGVPRQFISGDPEILGALLNNEKRIVIDEALDPVANPSIEGRYRFTLAHEVGHWRLHRPLIVGNEDQASFLELHSSSNVICRTSQSKERVEIQANAYASCLLMPQHMLYAVWNERFGNTNPRVLKRRDRRNWSHIADAETQDTMNRYEQEKDDEALNRYVRPIADRFQVSMIAMRIRLEKIGLLHRETPRQRSLEMTA
jgi:Zn-dependent peptidase ImmA (M78 family)